MKLLTLQERLQFSQQILSLLFGHPLELGVSLFVGEQ